MNPPKSSTGLSGFLMFFKCFSQSVQVSSLFNTRIFQRRQWKTNNSQPSFVFLIPLEIPFHHSILIFPSYPHHIPMSGAGKTYTLAGQAGSSKTPSIQGIQDLAIGDLLRLAQESFEVRLTALEIYNESIQEGCARRSTGRWMDEIYEIQQRGWYLMINWWGIWWDIDLYSWYLTISFNYRRYLMIFRKLWHFRQVKIASHLRFFLLDVVAGSSFDLRRGLGQSSAQRASWSSTITRRFDFRCWDWSNMAHIWSFCFPPANNI